MIRYCGRICLVVRRSSRVSLIRTCGRVGAVGAVVVDRGWEVAGVSAVGAIGVNGGWIVARGGVGAVGL